jgi:hypothetical protein
VSVRRAAATEPAPYAELRAALDRHLTWASDYILAGDYGSAAEALYDAEAAKAELSPGRPGRPDR